jgi:hypothetical protein
MTLETPYVWASDGMKLWADTAQCPHKNDNACAFCDHDRYYAHKHRHMCPWFDPT